MEMGKKLTAKEKYRKGANTDSFIKAKRRRRKRRRNY